MSDESPFGDFTSDNPNQSSQNESSGEAQPISFDEDQPIALPPPDEGELSAFGLSSPPPPAGGMEGGDSLSGGEADGGEDVDPFASVDGGSNNNVAAGNFDSFAGGAPEPKQEEAAALRAWEEERAQVLRERQAKAEADKQRMLQEAKDELDKFYADREATLTKNKKTNRADEKNYRADMKSTFESGSRWEKVNKLISTQGSSAARSAPSASSSEKSAAAGAQGGASGSAATSRVERMRKLLVQLKAEKK